MNTENKIKHNLKMMVSYFNEFMNSIEEYQLIYKDDNNKLDCLDDILSSNNPFNRDLMEILFELYEYEENIKERL